MSKLLASFVALVLALSVVKPLYAREKMRIAWTGSAPSATLVTSKLAGTDTVVASTNLSLVREPEKLGFRDPFNIGTLKIQYHVNAVVTRKKTVKERRPMVQKVVRAFTEALHYIKTNKEYTQALIGKNPKTKDREGLERAYRADNVAFPEVPYPNAAGVKTLLDDMAPGDKKAAADPKSFVDMSLI